MNKDTSTLLYGHFGCAQRPEDSAQSPEIRWLSVVEATGKSAAKVAVN